VRNDNLALTLDVSRWSGAVSPLPAYDLYLRGDPPVSGSQVADAFGMLAHYTTRDAYRLIQQAGCIGLGLGCWLTPTGYAACMAPYNLGLSSPRDIGLLIDVRDMPLWGPGMSAPSGLHSLVWRGGAIEFFSPQSLGLERARLVPICGDCHR